MMSSAAQAMPASRLSLAARNSRSGTIALRAAGEAVGGERLALAPEHGVDRVDQALDRHLVGIVVAADETVFGEARSIRAAGAGNPAGSRGAKSNGAAVDMDVHSRLFFVEKAAGIRPSRVWF